ncbi:MAG: hypothetical protein QOH24_944, partial [Verrucomicrobiota bacterium]
MIWLVSANALTKVVTPFLLLRSAGLRQTFIRTLSLVERGESCLL